MIIFVHETPKNKTKTKAKNTDSTAPFFTSKTLSHQHFIRLFKLTTTSHERYHFIEFCSHIMFSGRRCPAAADAAAVTTTTPAAGAAAAAATTATTAKANTAATTNTAAAAAAAADTDY